MTFKAPFKPKPFYESMWELNHKDALHKDDQDCFLGLYIYFITSVVKVYFSKYQTNHIATAFIYSVERYSALYNY